MVVKDSNVNLNGKNGRREEYRREIEAQFEWEQNEVAAGRIENAILMQGVAGQWSIKQYLNAAFWKGKSWRYISALSDQALQIQGYALLNFVAEAAGADMAEMIMRKSVSALKRYRDILTLSEELGGEDPFVTQLYQETCEDIVQFAREHRHSYHRRVGRLLE